MFAISYFVPSGERAPAPPRSVPPSSLCGRWMGREALSG